jgi:hypothetical protein
MLIYAIGNLPLVTISFPVTICFVNVLVLLPNTNTKRTITAIARMALKMSDKFFIRFVS